MNHVLTQGVTLTLNNENVDYYVTLPVGPDVEVNLTILDKELVEFGLERMDEDECPAELEDDGLRVFCAEMTGGI